MILEHLVMNGYGQFVWAAFFFTFSSLTYLYMKTKSDLQKHQKAFLAEFEQGNSKKIKFKKEKIITEEALSVN